MKIKELFESKTDLAEFIDRWYDSHESVKAAEIEKIMDEFPEFVLSGAEIHRIIGIPVDYARDLLDLISTGEGELDPDKVDAFVKKREPNRYVSGSASERGYMNFVAKGGLDSRDYNVRVDYYPEHALYLAKMAKSISRKSSKHEQIIDVDEVIFKPVDGSTSTWIKPGEL
jgi:hypothetical protein